MSSTCPECMTTVGYNQKKCHLCDTVLLSEKDIVKRTRHRPPAEVPEDPAFLEAIKKEKEKINQLKKQHPDNWSTILVETIDKELSTLVKKDDDEQKKRWAKTKAFRDKLNEDRAKRGYRDNRILDCMPAPHDVAGLQIFYAELKKPS
jgi:hypothetical protein